MKLFVSGCSNDTITDNTNTLEYRVPVRELVKLGWISINVAGLPDLTTSTLLKLYQEIPTRILIWMCPSFCYKNLKNIQILKKMTRIEFYFDDHFKHMYDMIANFTIVYKSIESLESAT